MLLVSEEGVPNADDGRKIPPLDHEEHHGQIYEKPRLMGSVLTNGRADGWRVYERTGWAR